MAKKQKIAFVCTECGAEFPRWGGQCTSCGEWNVIKEIKLGANSGRQSRTTGYAGDHSEVKLLSEVDLSQAKRI